VLKLSDYRLVFASIGFVGILLFASPTLSLVLHLPAGEMFSELWVLGPGHMAEEYPFNVRAGENYSIYVGVGNHLGSVAYYAVYVKFRNQTEPLPDAFNGTPSVLSPLFEYRIFLGNNMDWEEEISFSFENLSFEGNLSKVSRLIINGYALDVDKIALWDGENRGFYFQVFFELWLYNTTISSFQFHNRFVDVWLNVTRNV